MSGFFGTFMCKVDAKGRVSIPARFRHHAGAETGVTFMVTRALQDKCLTLYAPDGWRRFQEKLQDLPSGKSKRTVTRFFSENSATLVLDKQGRLSIPRQFLTHCGVDKDAILVGTLESIEVWNPEEFRGQIEDVAEALSEVDHLL
jgi:MraZ protein